MSENSELHPAIAAAHDSWRCVRTRAKEEWLGLLAEDVTIEDPIGVAPTNPTGKGFRGRQEAEQFWDGQVAQTESIDFEVHESFAAGNESAHLLTLTTKFANGVTMKVHGIFTYTIDDERKIRALRGYWSLADSKVEKGEGPA
ncbi:MAG: nuclear transport factor 2 family protein [Myxococcota bacterium]